MQRFGDHVDTDAIIPGQFCHLVKFEELGEKAFHFVRPEFHARAVAGQSARDLERGRALLADEVATREHVETLETAHQVAQAQLRAALELGAVDGYACSHTCAPALRAACACRATISSLP